MTDSLLERLLNFYHIDFATYQKITAPTSLESFASGHSFSNMKEAVDLVNNVIQNNGRIIIYGDYDADGVMGTSILVKAFEYLGVKVDYYIPNRYLDGYGLNEKNAQKYINKYDLVITVDNGVTAFEAIKLLKDNNIDVLVLDHHQIQDTVPEASVVIHPSYSNFGDIASSGAFTAFIFTISLLGRIDKYLAILASISLISDMMPLLEYNRNLLRSVFDIYVEGEFFALDLLKDDEPFNENTIGMKIAPRINSVGRLCEDESINDIVKFFTSNDKNFILNYFNYLVEINDTRKSLSKIEIDESTLDLANKAIVIKGDYKEGIIGLVANTLMNKYHLPTVVFTKSVDGSLKGSARAPEGFDIVEAFGSISDLIITFGGHALAGGCSIKEEDFIAFKDRFSEFASSKPFIKVSHNYIELGISEFTFENYELINSFSPFGESWPTPLFKMKHIKVSSLSYSRDHKHIITTIGQRQKIVYFNVPFDKLKEADYIDIVGVIYKKNFKGYYYLEFNCKELIPCK